MGKGRHSNPARKMKPMILVFCEGDTENIYVNLLKARYRIPMKIVFKVTGQRISPELVMRHIKNERLSGNDTIHTFLFYDLDVVGISEKLQRCQGRMICCNPCTELWFLLHEKEQHAFLTTEACIQTLKNEPGWEDYKKGSLSEIQKHRLWEHRELACARAKTLNDFENPCASLYHLIELLSEQNTEV